LRFFIFPRSAWQMALPASPDHAQARRSGEGPSSNEVVRVMDHRAARSVGEGRAPRQIVRTGIDQRGALVMPTEPICRSVPARRSTRPHRFQREHTYRYTPIRLPPVRFASSPGHSRRPSTRITTSVFRDQSGCAGTILISCRSEQDPWCCRRAHRASAQRRPVHRATHRRNRHQRRRRQGHVSEDKQLAWELSCTCARRLGFVPQRIWGLPPPPASMIPTGHVCGS